MDRASDPEVLQMAVRYIRFNGLFYIPLMFVNVLRLSIQGMGYTKIAMLAGVFEMIARTLVALFLVPALGFTGACLPLLYPRHPRCPRPPACAFAAGPYAVPAQGGSRCAFSFSPICTET